MRLAIVGGCTPRGIETTYLAKKAGFEVIVIDKVRDAPAYSMADDHAVVAPQGEDSLAMNIFSDCDAVLPACENIGVLSKLDGMLRYTDTPFLLDIDSFMVSSSKPASNGLMEKTGVPIPKRWKEKCGYPAVVKPSSQSGSIGVRIVHSKEDMNNAVETIVSIGDVPVIQEYAPGKVVSLEILGNGREFRPFVLTEGMLNKDNDVKGVKCLPRSISAEREKELREIVESIAANLNLTSLMNVEAIDSVDGLKVLEFDARIPTQAPSAVLAATGINMLKEMTDPDGEWVRAGKCTDRGVASNEYLIVRDGKLMTCGENEYVKIRRPRITKWLFGSDEMITDYKEGSDEWRCAMINSARTEADLEKKRARCIEMIMSECGIKEFADESPL
jgi:pyrrolysine biosynthesis protein PylC